MAFFYRILNRVIWDRATVDWIISYGSVALTFNESFVYELLYCCLRLQWLVASDESYIIGFL